MSNFQIVTGPVFFVKCVKCGERISNDPRQNKDGGPLLADLDGEAFKAYYCATCVTERS
jgi:DNA-directed RNA polymerase subunit RPC12/RpoP